LTRLSSLLPSARRFPPPWTIEEHNDACFIVRDATGQALYFEEEFGQRSAAKLLNCDEARRMAANLAKLPEMLAEGLKRQAATDDASSLAAGYIGLWPRPRPPSRRYRRYSSA
jgi:hypothetical protein